LEVKMVRARTRAKPATKVKRLSFHQHKKERAKAEKTEKKQMKQVLTREKPIKKVPERLPYYKDNPPKYTPAAQPVKAPSTGHNIMMAMIYTVIMIIVLVIVWNFIGGDDGGGGGCPVTCQGSAIVIAPQCSCPSDSYYRDTISGGYKQCVCT